MKKFDATTANTYDKDIRLKIPGYDLIQESIAALLQLEDLESANALIAGSGSGEEICRLGLAHPSWTFTAVDPSAPMHDLAAEKIKELNVQNKVSYHQCKLEAFNSKTKYDLGLSVLVSHFISYGIDKRAYFQKWGEALKPGAPLIMVDLVRKKNDLHDKMISATCAWAKNHGLQGNDLQNMPLRMKTLFFPLTERELKDILSECDLVLEARFVQSFGITGFLARKK